MKRRRESKSGLVVFLDEEDPLLVDGQVLAQQVGAVLHHGEHVPCGDGVALGLIKYSVWREGASGGGGGW